MQDYTIGESYTLPSLGKVYDTPIDPEITIRSMTTTEEMKRVANTDKPYQTMSEIIDACLVKGPGISSYDLCIGDYQFLLHRLRAVTYGPHYPISTRCIFCGSEFSDTINLDSLEVMQYTEEFDKMREFDLPKTGKHIRLRVQTPRLIEKVNEITKDIKKKSKVDNSLVYTIVSLIDTVNGNKVDQIKLEQWVRSLPMMDTNFILKKAEKLNDSIGVNTELECTCDVCKLSFTSSMKTTTEFFRPDIDA